MNKRTKYTSGKRTMVWMAGMLLSAQVFAQDLTVKGHVKDETGEPVIGANILIKGTTEGTISDLDGNFILPGVNPGDTLVISFVGYQPQEIPAAPTLQILLKEDSELLNEVVVIGYGSVGTINPVRYIPKRHKITITSKMVCHRIRHRNSSAASFSTKSRFYFCLHKSRN